MSPDQYFLPGDKVMRVADPPDRRIIRPEIPRPEFGVVYCVEACWTCSLGINLVMFVGFGGPYFTPRLKNPCGFRASCFRKVEEIALCVRAVQKAEKTVEVRP